MNPLTGESVLCGKKILVVNNDPEVSGILEKKLSDTYPNCEVEKVATNEEAVEKLESWNYDLLILDITQAWSPYVLKHALERNLPVVVFKSLFEIPKLLDASKK
jgi:CheY-like chemotaxis protein